MPNVQPTGEVTVGVDRTGKHYMYEKGKGAGRQPLNLPDEVSQSLAAAGMSPGNPLHMSGAQAQQLQGYKTNVGKGKPVEDLKSLSKYFQGQNQWVQKSGDPSERLDILASDDRLKVLRGPKSKEGQVVSAMVMSTILGREVAYKEVDESKYKIVFNLGTDTRDGYIKIKQGEKELHKIEFKSPKDLTPEEITHFRNTFSTLKAQEHIAKIRDRAAASLRTSGLDPQMQSTYQGYLKEATEGLSERAAKAMRDNITQYHFYSGLNDLNKASTSKTPVLGFFRLEPSKGKGKGSLHLNSYDANSENFPTAAHVYSHELFHAVDGLEKSTMTGISSNPSFRDAWRAEAGDISNYAKTAPWEGFAEFGRMVQCGGYSRDELHEKFPKTAAFFEAEGLLSPVLKEKVNRVKTPMDPVFGQPVVEGDMIGDSPVGTVRPFTDDDFPNPRVIRPSDPNSPETFEPNPEMPPQATPAPTGQEPIDTARVNQLRGKHTPETYKIPQSHSRSAPAYGFHDRNFNVKFANDYDRASYILSNPGKSAGHDTLLNHVKKSGLDYSAMQKRGEELRGNLKEQATHAPADWKHLTAGAPMDPGTKGQATPETYTLPKSHSRISPAYGYKKSNHPIVFSNDYDKAAYTLSGMGESKSHKALIEHAKNAGLDQKALLARGAEIRKFLKSHAATAEKDSPIEVK